MKSYIMSLKKYEPINRDVLEFASKKKREKTWHAKEWKALYGEAIACEVKACSIEHALFRASKEYHLKSDEFIIHDILT